MVTGETIQKTTLVESDNDHHFHSLPDSPREASEHREDWEQRVESEADHPSAGVAIHKENA